MIESVFIRISSSSFLTSSVLGIYPLTLLKMIDFQFFASPPSLNLFDYIPTALPSQIALLFAHETAKQTHNRPIIDNFVSHCPVPRWGILIGSGLLISFQNHPVKGMPGNRAHLSVSFVVFARSRYDTHSRTRANTPSAAH
jgi:hypothetical protein